MVRAKLTLLDRFNLFLDIYGKLLSSLLRVTWYSPFFIIALFQLLGMALFLWYYAPALIFIVKPILSQFVPPQAFHYPQYYLALRTIYAGYEAFVLGPTIWVIFLSVAIGRLSAAFSRQWVTMREGLDMAFNRYWRMLLIMAIETALTVLILYLPSIVLRGLTRGSPNMSAGLGVVLQAGGLLVSAMLIYAAIGVVLDNKRAGEAIRDGIAAFFRHPIITFSIVFIPNSIRLVLNAFLSDYAPRIISMMNPDLIPILMVIYILSGIFINFFVYGAAILLYRRLE